MKYDWGQRDGEEGLDVGNGARKQKEGDSKTNLAEIWRMLFCLLVSG